MNTRGRDVSGAGPARLVRAVDGEGFLAAPALPPPCRSSGVLLIGGLPAPSLGVAVASAAALPLAAAFAASRSARFSRISTIVGQSSLRQSFQGRPRKPLTVSRGISPQTEQRSSSRQSS